MTGTAEGQRTDDAAPIPAEKLRALVLKHAVDDEIRRPLWEFRPEWRKAVIHERRRRFGVFDDE